MIGQITANDLKVQGISAIDDLVAQNEGVIITVRGKEKYVVLSIEEYNQLRMYELEMAIIEAKKDIADGKVLSNSIEEHLGRVGNV